MKPRLMYIELKTGYSDDGPAWIGMVNFSKTGRTAYFNGKGFKQAGKGHYSDLETLENYWISGVKKNGEDRHRFGKGKIMIDSQVVSEYLKIIGSSILDKNRYEIIEIEQTDINRLSKIENETYEQGMDFSSLYHKELRKLKDREIDFLIDECERQIQSARYNKARRELGIGKREIIEEREKRKIRTTTT